MFKNQMGSRKFWEVLEESGMYKENWGYEGILNIIILCERKEAKECEECGLYESANTHHKRADFLYRYLEKLGYYSDIY